MRVPQTPVGPGLPGGSCGTRHPHSGSSALGGCQELRAGRPGQEGDIQVPSAPRPHPCSPGVAAVPVDSVAVRVGSGGVLRAR